MRKARIISLVWCVCLTGMYVYTGDYLFAEMLVFTLALFAAAVLTCIFGGKKLEISLELMEAAKKKQEFKGKAVFYNDSAFPVFYGICHLKWKNTLTGEQGIMKIPFAAAGKRKAEVLFSGNSSFCGDCCFSVEKWECFDFLRIFKKKRQGNAAADVVIVPEVSSLNMELLTKEAYDMESYRYSSDRKGDDPGETFDIRDYRPGDSIKQIHWKLTGKLDHVVIKEMSYPVYDSVLILPELFCENGQPEKKDALAEIFASAAMSFLNRKIPFETGFYDGATDRFYMERIETEEDFWNVIYLFLRSAAYENSAKTIEEYLENYGERRFAHYIYITAQGKTQEEDELQAFGETTVLRCGDSFEVRENEIQCTPGSWKKELGAQDIWR